MSGQCAARWRRHLQLCLRGLALRAAVGVEHAAAGGQPACLAVDSCSALPPVRNSWQGPSQGLVALASPFTPLPLLTSPSPHPPLTLPSPSPTPLLPALGLSQPPVTQLPAYLHPGVPTMHAPSSWAAKAASQATGCCIAVGPPGGAAPTVATVAGVSVWQQQQQ
ncbi:hypothetical protein V8C86DRAFT_1463058 [Haematococcus lacustris]